MYIHEIEVDMRGGTADGTTDKLRVF